MRLHHSLYAKARSDMARTCSAPSVAQLAVWLPLQVARSSGLRNRSCRAHLEVLSHQPGLKGRVEEGGSNTTEEAAHQEHVVVVPVLGEAAQRVGCNIQQGSLLAAPASQDWAGACGLLA